MAQVEGASTYQDPNHPVETYFGSAKYNDLFLMIHNLDVTVYPEDKVAAVPDPSMGIGSQITITRATPVNITDAKTLTVYHTWDKTVGQLLKDHGIVLLGQDSASPGEAAKITYKMNIKITRVAEVDITDTQVIPYKTITENDSTRYRGEPDIVKQTGQNGQKILTYHIRREDGVEISRKLTNTDTTPAQNKIISHGTKLKIKTTISGRATWYSSRYNAASHVWPKGTHVRVTNPANGKSIETIIDDYMESDQSVIDLNKSLFQQLADPYGTMPTLTVDWVLN